MTGFWSFWTKEDGDSVGKLFSSDIDMSVPEAVEKTYRENLTEPYNKTGWSRSDMKNEFFPHSSDLGCKTMVCQETGCAGKRHCGVH